MRGNMPPCEQIGSSRRLRSEMAPATPYNRFHKMLMITTHLVHINGEYLLHIIEWRNHRYEKALQAVEWARWAAIAYGCP